MLGLFRKRQTNEPAIRSIPEGQRVYAVGDIHGCLGLVNDLIARIEADDRARGSAQTQIVFLGDLVDRGPDSAGVVERLITLAETRGNVRFILGNHEEIFLRALDGDMESLRLFVRIGGRETILSYGVSESDYEGTDYEELLALMQTHVPVRHIEFLKSFEDRIEIGGYVFVHAGVNPARPLEDQNPEDLLWIREPFLSSDADFGRIVVHGHTPGNCPEVRRNRINIDTGAFYTGRLTCLVLEGDSRRFLSAVDH